MDEYNFFLHNWTGRRSSADDKFLTFTSLGLQFDNKAFSVSIFKHEIPEITTRVALITFFILLISGIILYFYFNLNPFNVVVLVLLLSSFPTLLAGFWEEKETVRVSKNSTVDQRIDYSRFILSRHDEKVDNFDRKFYIKKVCYLCLKNADEGYLRMLYEEGVNEAMKPMPESAPLSSNFHGKYPYRTIAFLTQEDKLVSLFPPGVDPLNPGVGCPKYESDPKIINYLFDKFPELQLEKDYYIFESGFIKSRP